ncbi:MAG: glycosyltransferase family protein [Roseiflexaceae bacterium]
MYVSHQNRLLHRGERFTNQVPSGRRLRVALYSHDTMGLGHTRRNLLIAQSLVHSMLPVDVLLIRGAIEGAPPILPPSIDCLVLPALRKGSDGQYEARRLDVSLQELIGLRSLTIQAALMAYRPDMVVVDNVPRGAVGELDLVLASLRSRQQTHCVLGLRDILDHPDVVRREWAAAKNEEAIRAYYDSIWVYGDPAVYDTAREYGFDRDIAERIEYVGYLDQRARLSYSDEPDLLPGLGLPPERLLLCLVGGGQDGNELAEAFSQAELPRGCNGVIVTGPLMDPAVQARLHMAAAQNPRLRVLTYVAEPTRLIAQADRVVAMGGYNTVAELLSFERHSLIVPRVRPRREQLIRAERLADLGLVDLLHPDQLSPAALSEWLARPHHQPTRVHGRINTTGLNRISQLVHGLAVANPAVARLQEELIACNTRSTMTSKTGLTGIAGVLATS